MPELGQTIGPYRLLQPLGQGGMGVVWRAEPLEGGAAVALKTVRVSNECMLQSLRREIRALARIRHPGVVRILEEGLWEGMPWYAMELLEGKTLRQVSNEIAAAAFEPSDSEGSAEGSGRPRWWTHSLLETQSQAPGEAAAATGFAALENAPAGPAGASRPVAAVRPRAAGGQLGRVLSLMRGLCEPLSFLHGEGIVHCDLKPENVLVRGT